MKVVCLAELRKNKGLTQKKLAELLNISSGAIAMYETGKRQPSLSTALKIASIFNMPIESILFYIPPNENK